MAKKHNSHLAGTYMPKMVFSHSPTLMNDQVRPRVCTIVLVCVRVSRREINLLIET